MTQMAGKEGIRGDIAVALEGVLDGRSGAEVLVQALIKFEFADSLEELVRAIEEKALTSEHARVSLMSLLGLHRVAATLLQRVRSGAVPAREGACYELGMLAQRAGNNALDEVLDDLALMGI